MYMLYDSTYSKISRKYTLIYNDKKQFWLPGDGIGEQNYRGNLRIKYTHSMAVVV